MRLYDDDIAAMTMFHQSAIPLTTDENFIFACIKSSLQEFEAIDSKKLYQQFISY